jgi:DNA polymerase IIIc chi subunit
MAGLFARILGTGGRKILRYPKTVTVDMMASQKAKEALREKFNKTKGKGMTLKEADTLRFKVD